MLLGCLRHILQDQSRPRYLGQDRHDGMTLPVSVFSTSGSDFGPSEMDCAPVISPHIFGPLETLSTVPAVSPQSQLEELNRDGAKAPWLAPMGETRSSPMQANLHPSKSPLKVYSRRKNGTKHVIEVSSNPLGVEVPIMDTSAGTSSLILDNSEI